MGIDGNLANRQKATFVPNYKQTKAPMPKNGQLTITQAKMIAKKHGLNLGTITKKGKALRGTRPKEVLFLNPDQNSPFPYIKKVVK